MIILSPVPGGRVHLPPHPTPPPGPPLCTHCGQRPGTIRDSPMLGQRNLCPPCHRRAQRALIEPPGPPRPAAGCPSPQCPDHPGVPVPLTTVHQHAPRPDLGYSPDEIAAAGTLVCCAAPQCPWWAWSGLILDPTLVTLLSTRHAEPAAPPR